jgi:hypothetical protein
MSGTRPATTSEDSSSAVDRETFLAVVITDERSGVLRALTQQAVQEFGRDQLFVRDVRVASTDGGATFLATALFSASAPQA